MGRDLRYRSAGLIFYILFALLICSSSVVSGKINKSLSRIFSETNDGRQSTNTVIDIDTEQYPKFLVNIEEVQSSNENSNSIDSNLLIALVGVGITIFTSDAIGYILSTIFIFCFNCSGGYSGLYKRKLKNKAYRTILIDDLYDALCISKNKNPLLNFLTSLNTLEHDPLYVFFIHHTKDLPESLDKWIERRNTAFFSGWTNATSIIIAIVLAYLIYIFTPLIPTIITWLVLVLSICIGAIILYNGYKARQEVLQAIDLRIAMKLNPNIQNVYNKYNNPLENNNTSDNTGET